MNHFEIHLCAICGDERSGNQPRFLLAENSWEDKLTILEWNEQAASRPGIKIACGIDHVEELAIHWMTTGSLDYPFARTALGAAGWRRTVTPGLRVDLSGTRQLGELAVHRESIERILADQPHFLQAILDALLDALRQEVSIDAKAAVLRTDGRKTEDRRKEKVLCAVSSEPEF